MTGPFAWTDLEVREALGFGSPASISGLSFGGVSTDTRTMKPGDLYVALEGERFDGHDFVGAAAQRGARGAVVSRSVETEPSIHLYLIGDTLRALGDLARHRRRALSGEVVGITGSSGKTTAKELLAAALSGSFEVYSTKGNLNNRVGVPLSLLEAPEGAEYLVIEMGTSEPGEIATLTDIAEPDHALVTTVGEAHLTGLDSLEGVLDEKLDLVRGARPEGRVVVGDDPPLLAESARTLRPDVHVAGLSSGADEDCRGRLGPQHGDGSYELSLGGYPVRAGIPGRHGAQNLVLALSTARLLGADLETAAVKASAVKPGPLRGEVRRVGGLTMLLDCYNANPQSVLAALDLLADLPGSGRRVALLGSMLELGDRSRDLHRAVLERARALPLDIVVASGEFEVAATELDPAAKGAEGRGPEIVAATTAIEAYRALRPLLHGTETVLLKGSRGVALESLVERFSEDFGDALGEWSPGAQGGPDGAGGV